MCWACRAGEVVYLVDLDENGINHIVSVRVWNAHFSHCKLACSRECPAAELA